MEEAGGFGPELFKNLTLDLVHYLHILRGADFHQHLFFKIT